VLFHLSHFIFTYLRQGDASLDKELEVPITFWQWSGSWPNPPWRQSVCPNAVVHILTTWRTRADGERRPLSGWLRSGPDCWSWWLPTCSGVFPVQRCVHLWLNFYADPICRFTWNC